MVSGASCVGQESWLYVEVASPTSDWARAHLPAPQVTPAPRAPAKLRFCPVRYSAVGQPMGRGRPVYIQEIFIRPAYYCVGVRVFARRGRLCASNCCVVIARVIFFCCGSFLFLRRRFLSVSISYFLVLGFVRRGFNSVASVAGSIMLAPFCLRRAILLASSLLPPSRHFACAFFSPGLYAVSPNCFAPFFAPVLLAPFLPPFCLRLFCARFVSEKNPKT